MGRIRTVKPELFTDEDLYDAEAASDLPLRLAFIGLWTQADREGRFRWAPRTLKSAILPYDQVDFGHILDALAAGGFIVKYEYSARVPSRVDDACLTRDNVEFFGFIPTWSRHQVVNNREGESILPDPAEGVIVSHGRKRGLWSLESLPPRVPHASTTRARRKGREGKGREGKGTNSGELEKLPEPTLPEPGFLTNDGRTWFLPVALYDRFCKVYPGADILAELNKASLWLETTPKKRKTWGGMARFLTTWLERAQNSGRTTAPPPPKNNGSKYAL